jgi:nitronate monooxygenase
LNPNNPDPLTDAQLAELFNTLLEAERAGVRVLTEYEKAFAGQPQAVEVLVASRHDEGRYCKLLYGYLQELGADISRQVGSFAEKALAVEGRADKLSFLNRGQGWVARELAKALPRVPYPHMREGLQEMLDTHRANIATCEKLIAGLR